MKLVAVLHGYFGKRREILLSHCFNHFHHPVRDDRLGPMLHAHTQCNQYVKCNLNEYYFQYYHYFYADSNIGGVTFRRQLVCTLVCMPEVLPTGFFSALACNKLHIL